VTSSETRAIAMDLDDRLWMISADLDDGLTLQSFEGDSVAKRILAPSSDVGIRFGDFEIDQNGTMHFCFGFHHGDIYYARFSASDDWEQWSLHDELNPQWTSRATSRYVHSCPTTTGRLFG
jgi:hypothetical protein